MADGDVRVVQAYDLAAIATALGITKRSAERRSTKESWPFEVRDVRGGKKRFYPEAGLPADVRDALQRAAALRAAAELKRSPHYQAGATVARLSNIAEAVDAAVVQRQREQGAKDAVGLSGNRRGRMDAKMEVLALLSTFAQVRGVGICKAIDEFCAAYQGGELELSANVRQFVGDSVHPATLRRWKRDLKTRGMAALAGNYGHRAGTGLLDSDEAMHTFAVGLIVDKPHVDANAMLLALQARFPGQDIPSRRTMQRWMKHWKETNAEALLSVANPDAWKNKYKAAFGSASEGIVRVNQRWELDSTPGDIDLIDGRHCIIGGIDVATRRLRLHVSKTSSAEGVCSLLRRAILDWGVPEEVKIDNGRDYASHRVKRALHGLEVDRIFSQPFSPWEKPHIERAFRSFSHGLLELLPGYTGHNVAEAQALRAKDAFADRLFKKGTVTDIKLTARELQEFCDRWTDELYAHKPHDGLNDETPFQRAAAMRDIERRVTDARVLDLLMAEAPDGNGLRTVGKKGIKLDRHWYIAPELVALIRQPVQVLYDEADAGRVVVYHNDAFVCVAECPELQGVSRKEIANEARARQSAEVSAKRRELKAIKRKARTADIVGEILDRKREEAAQLAAFPAPNVVHLTPGLTQASEAASALDGTAVPVTPVAPSTIADVDDVTRLLQREHAQDETAEQRFAWALSVLMKEADERNDIERQRLKQYLNSDEWNGRWLVFEYFGPEELHLPAEYAALLPGGTQRNRLIEAQQGI